MDEHHGEVTHDFHSDDYRSDHELQDYIRCNQSSLEASVVINGLAHQVSNDVTIHIRALDLCDHQKRVIDRLASEARLFRRHSTNFPFYSIACISNRSTIGHQHTCPDTFNI